MSSKLFKHKKTGKLYSIVQKDIKIKEVNYFDDTNTPTLTWINGYVLYKAEWDCPNGPYFVRHKKDFYDNFEEVVQDHEIQSS